MPSLYSGLQRISASGGEPRALTTPDAATLESHNFPQILPDEEHVLFETDKTGPNAVPRATVVSLQTGEQRVVAENAAYPRYLPEGFSSSREAARFSRPVQPEAARSLRPCSAVARRSPDESALHECGPHDSLIRRNARLPFERAVSEDSRLGGQGRRLGAPSFSIGPLFRSRHLTGRNTLGGADRREARIVRLLIGDLARGTLTGVPAEGSLQCLAWAPDGKRIALNYSANPQDLED